MNSQGLANSGLVTLKSRLPWLLAIAAALLWAAPMFALLAQTAWQTEAGSVGPLTLILGLAILWHELRGLHERYGKGNSLVFAGGMAGGLIVYAFAIAVSFTTLAVTAAWIVLVVALYWLYGWDVVRRLWFSLAYLLLVLPLPYSLTYSAGAWLGTALAKFVCGFLQMAGLEAAYRGNMLYIDQYELSVELACAGLSSTISLVAVSVLYARWMHRDNPIRIAVLLLFAFPVAFSANLMRVAMLALAVHWFGTGVLGSFFHPMSGFISFIVALLLILGVDRALSLIPWKSR
jgi:exosortase